MGKMAHAFKVAAFDGVVRSRLIPPSVLAVILNIAMSLSGRRMTIRSLSGGGFLCTDGEWEVFVPRRRRLESVFPSIEESIAQYEAIYCLDQVPIGPDDIVFDCGAHIGMVSLALAKRQAHVYAFEPDPTEAAAVRRNLGSLGTVSEVALWKATGVLGLSLSNDSGDSSLWTDGSNGPVVQVATITLDDWCRDNLPGNGRVRLLKLEAEGAEPEVLAGAQKSLSRVDYVTADLGFERAGDAESTFVPVANTLSANGFELIGLSQKALTRGRLVVLFKNSHSPSAQ